MADQFWSAAAKAMDSLQLPPGATGLLAELSAPLASFREWASDVHQEDRVKSYALSGGLLDAGRHYHGRDGSNAASLSWDGTGASGVSDSLDETRFQGANWPSQPDAEHPGSSAREVVQWAMEKLKPCDEIVAGVMGLSPLAEWAMPLDCDWGSLQIAAEHINFLGSNYGALSSNVRDGVKWLKPHWSGTGADSFANAAGVLCGRALDRGSGMKEISSVVQAGGQRIERLAANQSKALVMDLMRPTSFGKSTLPLSAWTAALPCLIPDGMRGEITSRIASAKDAASRRHQEIVETLGMIQGVLHGAGQGVGVSAASLESPDELVPEFETARFGHNDDYFWEVSFASPGR